MMENCFWSFWTPQKYIFCERQLCSWVQQPANTWSNVSYLLAAIFILASSQDKFEKRFFSTVSFVLFIGSTLFHMSGTRIGKIFDVGAMLVLSAGVCSLSLKHYYELTKQKVLLSFSLLLSVGLIFLAIFDFGNIPFGLELIFAVYLEIRMKREGRKSLDMKRVSLVLGIEALAVVFLLLDVTRTWCDVDNHLLNGHAIWHLLSGAAIYVYATTKRSRSFA
jgi:hypothetical protein